MQAPPLKVTSAVETQVIIQPYLVWIAPSPLVVGLCLLLFFSLAASPVFADGPIFEEERKFGTAVDYTYGLAVGDLNGDGALDIVTGNQGQYNLIYFNNGLAGFSDAQTFDSNNRETFGVAVGDIDGDGDLDIVTANKGEQNFIYLNDGVGNFSENRNIGTGEDNTLALAIADMNSDGYLDIIAGNDGEQNLIYLNDGTGSFPNTIPFGTGSDSTYTLAVADIDGNGNLDVAVGNYGQQNVVYLNSGASTFDNSIDIGFDGDVTQSIVVGDLNDDGKPDIVVANGNGSSGNQNNVYLQDGTGQFSTPQAFGLGLYDTEVIALGDVNGDGFLDIVSGNNGDSDDDSNDDDGLMQNVVYLNDQNGNFANANAITFGPSKGLETFSLALADLDNDGYLDIATGNENRQNVIYLNDGGGTFTEMRDFGPSDEDTWTVMVGDVNSDNALDIFVGNSEQQNWVYINDGNGNFSDVNTKTFGTGTDDTRTMAVADLNGDDRLDIVTGNYNESNQIYFQDGSQNFVLSQTLGSPDSGTIIIVIADMDGEHGLDIIVGNGQGPADSDAEPGTRQNEIYFNDGTGAFSVPVPFGPNGDNTRGLAVGDIDGDGDLDIVAGNYIQKNRLYLNDGVGNLTLGSDFGTYFETTNSVVLADTDGNGSLDIIAGNEIDQNEIYLNDGAGQFSAGISDFTVDGAATFDIAVGDIDNDGDLDIGMGNTIQQNIVYINDGLGGFATSRTFGNQANDTASLAWGDIDNDGDLDMIVGNDGGQNTIYLNHLKSNLGSAVSLPQVTVTRPVSTQNADFFSTPLVITNQIIPIPFEVTLTESNKIGRIVGSFSIDGGGQWQPAVATNPITTNISSGSYTYQWDTFASGFFGESDNVVFRISAYPQGFVNDTYTYLNSVAGPIQRPYGSATTFPFRVRGTQIQVISGTQPISQALVFRLPSGKASDGAPIADAGGTPYLTDDQGYLQGRGNMGIGDTLVALNPVHNAVNYAVGLSFDGEDDFAQAAPAQLPQLDALTLSFWVNSSHNYDDAPLFSYSLPNLDTVFLVEDPNNLTIQRGNTAFLTGVKLTEGQWQHIAITWRDSDDHLIVYKNGEVVFTNTLDGDALPQSVEAVLTLGYNPATDTYFNGHLDDVQLWRTVRTQAQIEADMRQTLTGSEVGLEAYWPLNQRNQFQALDLADSGNQNHLFLRGATWAGQNLGGFTVYHTNLVPTISGLSGHTVTTAGVQTITASSAHPLVLFDLNLSLEWDARNDLAFLDQLETDLQRTSAILFDATDGQAALGQITIYHNREFWDGADIRIYASNNIRPNATLGGIRTDVYTEVIATNPHAVTTPYTQTFGPGRVNMGPIWNRFGEADGTIGEDWPRVMAHELGHYLFYLNEDYLGLENNLAVSVSGCNGTLMNDPYREDFSEFHLDAGWNVPNTSPCLDTLQAQYSEVSDWSTITKFYPWLNKPTQVFAGPGSLPLAVTQILEITPTNITTSTVDVPIFYMTDNAGTRQFPNSQSSAFLFLQEGDRLIDLGRPTQDKVRTWGLRPGDELCVYELSGSQPRLGCEKVTMGDDRLVLVEKVGWQPDITVTPVASTTIGIVATIPSIIGLDLYGQLYPDNDQPTVPILLSQNGDSYSGNFVLRVPSEQGYIRIWVNEAGGQRREMVAGYALTGNPGKITGGFGKITGGFGKITGGFGKITGGFGKITGGFGKITGGFGKITGGFGKITGGFAPVAASSDGQVILFGNIKFAEGSFYALQKASTLPTPPPWATVVGTGYHLIASSTAPNFTGTSLNFRYLGRDVPEGEEAFLSLYYWNDQVIPNQWDRLATRLNPEFNEASAATHPNGAGIYALMSSIPIPLTQAGWNLVSYPVQGQRPIAEALASIEGKYTLVYGYDSTNEADPWQVYGTQSLSNQPIPAWVNTLTEMAFAEGYWINATEPMTWFVQGAANTDSVATRNGLFPPATYYGRVQSTVDFIPTANMSITALIDNVSCGETRTQNMGSEIVYRIHINSADPTNVNCGTSNKSITFMIDNKPVVETATWQNQAIVELNLQPVSSSPPSMDRFYYMPLIFK